MIGISCLLTLDYISSLVDHIMYKQEIVMNHHDRNGSNALVHSTKCYKASRAMFFNYPYFDYNSNPITQQQPTLYTVILSFSICFQVIA